MIRWNAKGRKPEAVYAATVMKCLRLMYGPRMWETAFPGGLGSRSGIPDRLICIDGVFVAIEFKNPGGHGRLGPKQKLELAAIEGAGGMALVVQCDDDLGPLFDRLPPTQRLLPGKVAGKVRA